MSTKKDNIIQQPSLDENVCDSCGCLMREDSGTGLCSYCYDKHINRPCFICREQRTIFSENMCFDCWWKLRG